MHCKSNLIFLLTLLLSVTYTSASTFDIAARNPPINVQARSYAIRAPPFTSASTYMRRSEHDNLYEVLRRRAASISRRYPQRFGPIPRPLTPQQKEARKKAQEEKKRKDEIGQKQRNEQKAKEVIEHEKKEKENSAKQIDDENDRAKNYIAYANQRLEKDKGKKTNKGEKTPEQIAQVQKEAALKNEKSKDLRIIQKYDETAKGLQNGEFNKDGNAKSEAQKSKERALAGFMKFLEVFQEVVSVLATCFPGPGQVLGVGIRLGSVAAKTASALSKIAKVGKAGMKAEKFGEEVKRILEMPSGAQEIPGLQGKAMAEAQQQMIDELIKQATANTQKTEKIIQDKTPTGPPTRKMCAPRAVRGIQMGWIEKGGCLKPLPIRRRRGLGFARSRARHPL
ncbi:hypothetical protein MMC30_000926 [Trapelia coarctata]|nr:hypothetical protein [Trapelia coarctata]